MNDNVSLGRTEFMPLFNASEKYLNEHRMKGHSISEKRMNLWTERVEYLKRSVDDGYSASGDTASTVTPLATTPTTEWSLIYMDHIQWDDGCSPTSAAMILEYHGENGYSGLDLSDWWYTEPTDVDGDIYFDDPSNEHTDLTEELHEAMGTSNDGVTWPWMFDDGIETVASDHGYNFDANNKYGAYYLSDYVSQIDVGNPVMISSEGGFPGYSGGHSVAGAGYQYTTDWETIWDEYYIVLDPNNDDYLYWSLAAVNWEMYTQVIP